jgi:semaphorin 6
VEGRYNSEESKRIIYGIFTTPINAIGGSAICAYQMSDILRVFEGSFKHQESINSNWLPVPEDKVPQPRPGQCVRDSRILQDKNVNFIKTHSLMEEAVPALFGKPVLVRVSLQYRFTAITVEQQVKTINNQYLDVLYIGTGESRLFTLDFFTSCCDRRRRESLEGGQHTQRGHGEGDRHLRKYGPAPRRRRQTTETGSRVREDRRRRKRRSEAHNLEPLLHCHGMQVRCRRCCGNRRVRCDFCSECVELQDPHCAWDAKQNACVSIDVVTSYRFLIQDVVRGDKSKCWSSQTGPSRESPASCCL